MKQTDRLYFRGQEFRAEDTDKTIEGHAAVFEQRTDIGGYFYEVIERGAFDDCDFKDVPLFFNHDFEQIPLARSRRNNGNSTLTLTVDDVGLAVRAKLDTENNPAAKTLYSSVVRGDVDGMSFAFIVDAEEWQDLKSDMPTRRIKKIGRVLDVSACTFPAYEGTDIHARALNTLESAKRALENARVQPPDGDKRCELELYKLKCQIFGG